jgi:hypothetical protein
MKPWEIAEHLTAAIDPEVVLKELKQTDPFWIGASYAVDPFVGVIYKLPLTDPRHHEQGLHPDMFDRVVRAILSGEIRGDRLAQTIEMVSRACTNDEWVRWYRPILEGKLDLKLPLALFNKYAPIPIAPPALNKPRTLTPAGTADVKPFFLQPAYDGRCFWLLDSRTALIDVRGYDEKIVRVRDPNIEKSLLELGKAKPVDVVIFGYLGGNFVVDDLVTRDQFSRESSVYPLRQRLEAAERLGLPLVQRSETMTVFDDTFMKELGLIFEQKFKAALVRDLDAPYPFRTQPDWKLSTKSWIKETSGKK